VKPSFRPSCEIVYIPSAVITVLKGCQQKMLTCSVFMYKNNNTQGMKFYSFPKERDIQNKLIIVCRRKDKFNLKTGK
jgi:hypothetical protein